MASAETILIIQIRKLEQTQCRLSQIRNILRISRGPHHRQTRCESFINVLACWLAGWHARPSDESGGSDMCMMGCVLQTRPMLMAHPVIFNKLVFALAPVCLDCMALADLMRNLFRYITYLLAQSRAERRRRRRHLAGESLISAKLWMKLVSYGCGVYSEAVCGLWDRRPGTDSISRNVGPHRVWDLLQ